MEDRLLPFQRPDYRKEDQLRHVRFEPGIAPYADGSVLVHFDNTKVICAATFEDKVPHWMKQQGVSGGWISAEYSMLPYSTLERKQRDIIKGKQEGRTIEIQRLIGRALRAVIDLKKMPGLTLWIDCDVLQADGGTRTAAINGAYIAAVLAVKKLMAKGKIKENPFVDSVAAVSVGIFQDALVMDLNYEEDKDAFVDFNVVMTGSGKFVEIQGGGEQGAFTETQMNDLIALAKQGIQKLTLLQQEALQK